MPFSESTDPGGPMDRRPTPCLPLFAERSPKNVPSAVKRIILELGLRYRPAAAEQIEPHQAKLVAMMGDLADLPPALLERAARHWVRQSAFMPKASDLVALVGSFVRAERGGLLRRLDVAALRNARIAEEPGARRDLRWIDDGGGLRLVDASKDRGDGA